MKTRIAFIFCLVTLGVVVMGPVSDREALPNQAEGQTLAAGINNFAIDLFSQMRKSEGNLFFSPYCISLSLALPYAGARGETAKELGRTLYPGLDQQAVPAAFQAVLRDLGSTATRQDSSLTLAAALWPAAGGTVSEDLLKVVRNYYMATVETLDYARNPQVAIETINEWAQTNTGGRIKDLVSPNVIKPVTRMVSTSAIYFKKDWAAAFDPKLTQEARFTLSNGNEIPIPLMNRTDSYPYMERDTFQGVELPYEGDRLSMAIFLPAKHDGLPALEELLTSKNLQEWVGEFRQQEVEVFVPRFSMKTNSELAAPLKAMGIQAAFSPSGADFSGIDPRERLHLSDVVHQSFVEVNEKGTEAAAATATVVQRTTSVRLPKIFRADRAFLFLVREKKSGGVLFLGRVQHPGK